MSESKSKKYHVTPVLDIDITGEDIDDIMSAALDGGITYWCCKAEVVGNRLGEYASEQISRGGSLKLYDIESDDVYELTRPKFLTGLRLWLENAPRVQFTDAGWLDIGNIDAPAADSIIQYALFNDIIYA